MDTEWVRQSCTKIEYSYQGRSAVSRLPLDNVHELKRNGKLSIIIDKRSEHTSHRFEPLFVNEWDLDDSFPILFLPIEIKRVEVEDR